MIIIGGSGGIDQDQSYLYKRAYPASTILLWHNMANTTLTGCMKQKNVCHVTN